MAAYPTIVRALLDDLTPAQLEVVNHDQGRLLLIGAAGTGKTHALLARFQALCERHAAPDGALLLTASRAAADALRGRLEEAIEGSYEALTVLAPEDLCAALLREQGIRFVVVSAAERRALLSDRIDELTLRTHDFGANPALLIERLVRRIDRLEQELVTAERYAAWADALPADGGQGDRFAREREFAQLYQDHDRLLAEGGAIDAGGLVLAALRVVRESPRARARLAERYRHVLVDDAHEMSFAQTQLVALLAPEGGTLVAAASDRGERPLLEGAPLVVLEGSTRCAQGLPVSYWRCANERAQAQGVAAEVERLVRQEGVAAESIAVLVRSLRDEGQAVAVALEERSVPYAVAGSSSFFLRAEIRDLLAWLRLLADPGDASAVVRAIARPPVELRSIDLARCTQIARRRKLDMISALAAATESPQVPPEARERILGFLELFRAAVAAFDTMRPDLYVHRLIERLGLRRQQLFSAQADVVERLLDLARFGELAASFTRRDPQASAREFARYVAALAEAGLSEEEEQQPVGELRRGGVRVLSMASARGLEFDHVYVIGLQADRMPGPWRPELDPIPRELLSRKPLPDDRDAHIACQRRLLDVATSRARQRLVLTYAEEGAPGTRRPPSSFLEEARVAAGAEWETRAEELFGPAEALHAAFRSLREELLADVGRVGGRLSELRLDTDLDLAHAVSRYLELVKLAALLERPSGQSIADALAEVNTRLFQAATGLQREILETSALDEHLLASERDERRRALAVAARDEPSLEPFLPRRGEGLALSASDVETYLACPLKYKFARVFRIPVEPTINQRFGIVVHQVLERYHTGEHPGSLAEILGSLDTSWRRAGFGASDRERQLQAKAVAALTRYHERFGAEQAEPVWVERSFSFKLGAHLMRGRVDRVDRLPDGGYELIDYKTGRPKSAEALRDDMQLALYAIAAREAWDLEAETRSYYYVLDDLKVRVGGAEVGGEWIRDTVEDVAQGILAQGFEPTPSYATCSQCDFRIVCPAAEL